MKVRMKTTYATPTQRCYPGGVIEVDVKEGRALIEGRYAEEVVEPPAPKAKNKSTEAVDGKDTTKDGK